MYNTRKTYGWVAVLLHWLMALFILGLFGLGLYMVELTYYDSLYKTLPFIHKSIGISLALVFIFRLIWKITNLKPEAVAGSSQFEQRAAKLVHLAFYVLIPCIMLSGYLISTADGSPINVFDLFSVPATVTSIPEQEDTAGFVHFYLACALIALVVLHAVAALKHHFINHDNTLRRMLGMSDET